MPHFPAEEVGLNALWCKAFVSEITPVLPYQKYITLRKKTTIPPKKNRAVARRPIRRRPIPRTPPSEGAYADGRGLSYFSALFQLFARDLRTFSKLFELFSSALFLLFLRLFPPHSTHYLPLGEGIARTFSVPFVYRKSRLRPGEAIHLARLLSLGLHRRGVSLCGFVPLKDYR